MTQSHTGRPVVEDIDLRLVAVSTTLLTLAYVLARKLIGAPAETREASHAAQPRLREGHRVPSSNPAVVPAAGANASAKPAAEYAAQLSVMPPSAEQVAAPMPVAETPLAWQTELPGAVSPRASDTGAAASKRQMKRPSFLPPRPEDERRVRRMAAKPTGRGAPDKSEANAPSGAPSAAGFLERLRHSLSPETSEPQRAPEPQGRWLGHLRRAQLEEGVTTVPKRAGPLPIGGTMPMLRTNDLRAYLNRRLAASAAEAANASVRKEGAAARPGSDKVGLVLKSLDAVLNHVLASGQGSAPRSLLVGAASSKLDATAEAISIARALVARREQVVLVDLSRGSETVSVALGLPRTPGLTDLTSGHAGFEDVVRLDGDTTLQVISAGNPKLADSNDENRRFARVFEALTQAYDSVVLHADREALRKLTPALKFELPVMVAVVPAGTGASVAKTNSSDFSALGCPVLVYEQNGKTTLARFLRRVAAV